MEVYIIRHTPVATGKEVCYGQSNVPLADTFLRDLEQLKSQLPKDFDTVFCSPLKRCTDLVEALGYNTIQYENALMEINFGDWENRTWNDINQNQLNNWMEDFVNVRPPKGERLIDLFDRVRLFLDNLRLQNHHRVLLVTHAGVIRCIWAYLLHIPLQNIFKIPVDYGRFIVVNLSSEHKLDSIKKLY